MPVPVVGRLTAAQFKDIVIKYYEKVNPSENAQAKAARAEEMVAKNTRHLVAGDAAQGRQPMDQNKAQQTAYVKVMSSLKNKYKLDCLQVWKETAAGASPSASGADGPATLKFGGNSPASSAAGQESTFSLKLGAATGAANKPTAQKSLFGSGTGSASASASATTPFGGFGANPASTPGFGTLAKQDSSSTGSSSGGFGSFGATPSSAGTTSSSGAFGTFGKPAATGFGAFAGASSATPATSGGFGTFGSTGAASSSAFGSPAAPSGGSAFGVAAGVGSQAPVPGQLTAEQFTDIVTKYYAKVRKLPLSAF
jgi:hypothetical protein